MNAPVHGVWWLPLLEVVDLMYVRFSVPLLVNSIIIGLHVGVARSTSVHTRIKDAKHIIVAENMFGLPMFVLCSLLLGPQES